MSELVSQAEFARLRNVAPPTVTQWKLRGKIVMDGLLVDVEASDALLAKRPKRYRGGTASQKPNAVEPPDDDDDSPPPPPSGHFASADWSHAEAARRKEVAIALKRQLDYDTAAGKLISAADVEAIMRSDYTTTVARILQIPSKVAPRVVAMHTASEVEALLHREFVKALNGLSEAAGEELRKINGSA
jgi:phage terminase Nu1 subunit (DNA packaging protein)